MNMKNGFDFAANAISINRFQWFRGNHWRRFNEITLQPIGTRHHTIANMLEFTFCVHVIFFSSSFSVLRMLIYRFIVVTCMWGVSFLVTFCYFYRLDLARFACISIYICLYVCNCNCVCVCVCFFPAPQSQFALKECINISVQRFSFRFKIPCDPFNSLFFFVRLLVLLENHLHQLNYGNNYETESLFVVVVKASKYSNGSLFMIRWVERKNYCNFYCGNIVGLFNACLNIRRVNKKPRERMKVFNARPERKNHITQNAFSWRVEPMFCHGNGLITYMCRFAWMNLEFPIEKPFDYQLHNCKRTQNSILCLFARWLNLRSIESFNARRQFKIPC